MKKRMALWGKNASEEKVLITFELLEKENQIKNLIFSESAITETIFKAIDQEWTRAKEVALPESIAEITSDLKITEGMVPEGYTVEKDDIIKRAQTEWHFVVLSSKLSTAFYDELEDIKEKVESLTGYDRKEWNRLSDFWKKVQDRIHNRDLLREHGNKLKGDVNDLFSKLKGMRSEFEKEFKEQSSEAQSFFMDKLNSIEERVGKDARLQGLFDELKDLQRKFKDAKLTKGHRSQIWKKLDSAFKVVKEKKFGDKGGNNNALERIERRYQGLMGALNKMKSSVGRDEAEMNFQSKRADNSDGQLEQQIRQAKIAMIEERLNSKKVKLDDMLKTKADLEKKIKKLKEKEAHQAKVNEAKAKVKENIAEEVKANQASMAEKDEELKKAAEKIASAKNKKKASPQTESVAAALSVTLGEAITDVIDTARAVIDVVGDKLDDKVEEIIETAKDVVEEVKNEISNKEEE